MIKSIFCFSFLLLTSILFSQSTQEDSLVAKLNNETSEISRIDILLKLAEICNIKDNLKYSSSIIKEVNTAKKNTKDSLQYKQLSASEGKAYEYAAIYFREKSFYNQEKQVENLLNAQAIYRDLSSWTEFDNITNMLSQSYSKSGDLYMELQTLKTALKTTTDKNNKTGMARYIYRIATFYAGIGDTTNAIKYADKGIELEKVINDSERIARGLYLGGLFYNQINKPKKAILYFEDALKKYIKSKDTLMTVNCLLGIAESNSMKDEYENAKKNLNNALDLATHLPASTYKALQVNYELGNLEYKYNFTDEAIRYHKYGLEESIKIGYPGGIATSNYCLAQVHLKIKQYKEAKQYASSSLELMKEISNSKKVMETEEICYKADSALGDYKNALIHFQAFTLLKNKLNTDDIKKSSLKEELENRFQLENEKQTARSAEEINRSRYVRNGFIIGSIVLLIFAGIILRSYLAKKKHSQELSLKNEEILAQKHTVEEKQKEIIDSINYAKRIQTSLLPTETYISKSFKRLKKGSDS